MFLIRFRHVIPKGAEEGGGRVPRAVYMPLVSDI